MGDGVLKTEFPRSLHLKSVRVLAETRASPKGPSVAAR